MDSERVIAELKKEVEQLKELIVLLSITKTTVPKYQYWNWLIESELWYKKGDAEKIMILLSRNLRNNGQKDLPPYEELRGNLIKAFGEENMHPDHIDNMLTYMYIQGFCRDLCKHYLLEAGLEVPNLEE